MQSVGKYSTLVYSDDPKDQKILDGSLDKKKNLDAQTSLIQSNSYTVVFRIEKSGRNGKPLPLLISFPSMKLF